MGTACPHHEAMKEVMDDHEIRLRSKRDRILSLEKDVENMSEKMDLIVTSQNEIKESIHKSDLWQTKVMTAFAVIMALIQAAPLIAGWLK